MKCLVFSSRIDLLTLIASVQASAQDINTQVHLAVINQQTNQLTK